MKILFVPNPSGVISHSIPLISLEAKLKQSNHESAFLLPERFHKMARTIDLNVLDVDHLRWSDGLRSELEAYSIFKPDIFVDDMSLTTLFAAQVTRKPRVAIIRRGIFSGELPRNKNHEHSVGNINLESIRSLGLPVPQKFSDLFAGEMKIIPGISKIEELPGTLRDDPTYTFCGPLLLEDSLLGKISNTLIGRESFCDANELAAFFSVNKRRVVIYFTFGTAAGTSKPICDAIRCLLDNGAAVVTTINVAGINKIQKELYFYSPFLPMHYVCSRVNGMVHHCGSGTYQFALLYQLPAITIGTRCHDREVVALKLEELGVSQHLPAPSECTDFFSRFNKTFESVFDPSGSWLIKARTKLIELKEESQKAMRNFDFEKILEEASARKKETNQVSISLRLTDVLSAMSKFKKNSTEPPRKRLFDIEVTRRCNVRCKFCPRDNITNQVHMEQDTFRNFLKNGQLHPADTIVFCGLGEPLLHPLLPEYLRQLKKCQPGIKVGVVTNGTLLNQRTVPPLLDNGIDFIYVSFNGITPETYENLMKGASFERTLKNLEYTSNEIHKRHLHTPSLQVIYLLSIENLQEKEKIDQFWSSRGITSVPNYIHSRGGFVKIEDMTPIDDSGFPNQKSCSVFKFYNYVAWNGNILSCCHDIQQNHVFGNINNERMEIITSRKQYAMDHNKWPKLCYKCNDVSRRHHIE